jgi:murein DD-endopeptidase MepM/ murein hydrolase activator NlpD
MRLYFVLLAFLLLHLHTSTFAQEKKKITAPKSLKITPGKKGNDQEKKATPSAEDTEETIEIEETEEDPSDFDPVFEPKKELSIVSEDTTTINEGETSIVEVDEEIQVDSVWIKIAGYYSIWDSRSVNPYHIDATQFKDTIPIRLYDDQHSWSAPLNKGVINSNFGFRGYRWHYGTDLDLDVGDTIKAAFDGIVRIAKWDGSGYGNYVLLRHYNGLETIYGHMTKSLVEVGQLVKAGQLIGWGGSTGRSSGPHLHYEVRYQGSAINPTLLYDFPNNLLLKDFFLLTAEYFEYLKRPIRSGGKSVRVRKVTYHKVRSGETLGSISRKFGVSITNLMRLNKMGRRSTIRAGQRLRIK